MTKFLKIFFITGAVLCLIMFSSLLLALDNIKDIALIIEPVNLILLGCGLIALSRFGRKKISEQ